MTNLRDMTRDLVKDVIKESKDYFDDLKLNPKKDLNQIKKYHQQHLDDLMDEFILKITNRLIG